MAMPLERAMLALAALTADLEVVANNLATMVVFGEEETTWEKREKKF